MQIRLSSIIGIRLAWVISFVACGLMGGLWVSACPAATPAGKTSDAKTPAVMALESAGLKSDNESLLAYLAQGGDLASQLLSELVGQLGAEDWKTREEATKKLIAMGTAAREAVAKAVTDPDPEVRTRAKRVLKSLKAYTPLSLVLHVIFERKLPGAVPILLERMSEMGSTDLRAARWALRACARVEDVPILRKTLKADNITAEARATVLFVLFRVSPETDMDLLKACLADNSMAIRKEGMSVLRRVPTFDECIVELLVNLLAEEDFLKNGMVRSLAIDTIVKMKGRGTATFLGELLAKNDLGLRMMALKALGRIHAPEAADAVIGVLGDHSNHVRSSACMLLANYAAPKAVDPLCRIVTSDNDPGVQRAAAFALGRIGDVRAVDSLIELIPANDYGQSPAQPPVRRSPRRTPEREAVYRTEAREQAMTALAMIGGGKATEALFQAAKHSPPRMRAMAIRLLAELGDKRAADLVVKGLSDDNYFMIYGAVNACQFVDDPRIRQPLIKLATSNRNAHAMMQYNPLGGSSAGRHFSIEVRMREQAMSLLKDRWPKEARPVLLGRLKDSRERIVRRAAEWLADANDKSAGPELMDLMEKSRYYSLKAAVGRSLCRLKVKVAFAPCLEVLQKLKDRPLAAAMGTLAQESCLDELEAELKKPDGLRLAALRVAEHVDKPELADIVVGLLDDKDVTIRNAAIAALGGLKNPKAVAPLLERLKAAMAPAEGRRETRTAVRDRDDQVALLAGALGAIGDKSAVEPLLAAMNRFQKDQVGFRTVIDIAKALGQIGDARTFEPLVKIVWIYPQAAEGLARLGDKRAMLYLQAAANATARAQESLLIARAIFMLDPDASVEALSKVLRSTYRKSDKPSVDAVELLAQVGSKKAIESIRFALTDRSFLVRQAARKALASLKVPAKKPVENSPAG